MFMASLICKVDVDVQKILICEMDIGCSNTLQFATQVTIITSESLLFDRMYPYTL